MTGIRRRGVRSALAVLCWAMLLALLGACGASTDSSAAALAFGPTPQCEVDTQCGQGSCHTELRICLAGEAPKRTVGFIVEPKEDQHLAPAHFASVALEGPTPTVDITLPKTVTLTGRVTVENNGLEPGLEASIVAVAEEDVIDGENRAAQTVTTDEFTLTLQAGVAYTIHITAPGPDTGRPAYRESLTLTEDSYQTFLLPAMQSLPTLVGRVVRIAGTRTEPLSQLRVTAIHVDTGHACTAVTTGKLGDYRLRCPHEKGSYAIVVRPTADGPVVPAFRARLAWGTSFIDHWPVRAGENNVPDIRVPLESPDFDVTIQVRSPDGTPIEGAEVGLVATLPDGQTWFDAELRRTATTDRNGVAILSAVAAGYELWVTPHAGQPWADFRELDWIFTEELVRVITVEARERVRGSVVSASGAPVPYATVTVRRLSDVEGGEAREFVGETTDTGSFDVPSESGPVEIEVKPRTESGLPRVVKRGLVLGDDGLTTDITVPAPLIVEGSVFSHGGEATVPGASVEAYEQGPSGAWERVGDAKTDETGRYFLMLGPAQ